MSRLLALLLALLLAGAPAGAVEVVPLLKLDLLGGQFFFQEANTSFSANSNFLFSPALKFSEKDSLVPTISNQYRRTREVRELIGGGFLTQESVDTLVGLKYIRQLDERWALKPNVSYKNEMIKESQDEELGKGLFDYHKLSFGLEAERRTERLNLRQSISAYGVRFPRYHALAADQTLGSEVLSGDRVLDFNAYDYSIGGEFLWLPTTVLNGTFLVSARPFLDQKIVTETGEYRRDDRFDLYGVAAIGGQQKLPDWSLRGISVENVAGFNLANTLLDSNQHNYDASQTRFNVDFYDYWEMSASPYYAARLGKKLAMTAAYDFSRRQYLARPVQRADSSYADGRIYIHTHTFSFQFLYPIWKGISVKTQGSYRLSESNMLFEQTYRYNYRSAHYFAGLTYSL